MTWKSLILGEYESASNHIHAFLGNSLIADKGRGLDYGPNPIHLYFR